MSFLRYRRQVVPSGLLGDEPTVMVQLPVFNERDVVDRLVPVIGTLDWPCQRLRIQLIDGSTGATPQQLDRDSLLTALADIPAITVMLTEAFGPMREPNELGRLPGIGA